MPVHTIEPDALSEALKGHTREQYKQSPQLRAWCASLEAGSVLYFPRTPVPIPPADIEVLLGQQQTGSRLHKNISYKPDADLLGGVDRKSTPAAEVEQLHAIMRRYSSAVADFLSKFLGPYENQWRRDYASYRPIEEKGRDLPLRRRNDLLHVDAFPTRPTRGMRILRFFHNIHPERTRDWAVGKPFAEIVGNFTPRKIPAPRPDGAVARAIKKMATATGLAKLVPQWKRTPYDEFMMRLHNTMKEDEEFQRTCAKEFVEFAPGSSWMVYTETVPHAALAGQYALEQTLLVDPHAMVTPESTPLARLEKLAGARLV
jgi:3-deoxy-D-manno-oct-2-ulosonic acid (Kdo) hydroxylase